MRFSSFEANTRIFGSNLIRYFLRRTGDCCFLDKYIFHAYTKGEIREKFTFKFKRVSLLSQSRFISIYHLYRMSHRWHSGQGVGLMAKKPEFDSLGQAFFSVN